MHKLHIPVVLKLGLTKPQGFGEVVAEVRLDQYKFTQAHKNVQSWSKLVLVSGVHVLLVSFL